MKKLLRNCTCHYTRKTLNFKLTESGFYISQEEPLLGAAPDTLIHCSRCGDECLEIKCTFPGTEKFIFALLSNDLFLLDENAITKLSVNYNYCYKIQCQSVLCN